MRNTKRQNAPKPPSVPLLPRETVEIAERSALFVSGVKGIEGYSPCCVRIKTAKGVLAVSGCGLTLCWAGEKRLLLRGKLEGIGFL